MQYQCFRGADVKEALSAVRASLGPDALIESTRHVNNGRAGALGHSWVEVTARAPNGRTTWPFETDSRPTVISPVVFGSTRAAPSLRHPSRLDTLIDPAAQRRPVDRTPTLGLDTAQLERELVSLRAMLNELNASRPPRERALALLAAMGVEGTLARELATGGGRMARRGADGLKRWLAQRITERISVGADPIALPGRQIVIAVGNTGVGKTTTLAKLAARARLDLGRKVTVLSLDSFRVGAVEQWQRYASLMGLPFHPVHGPDELAARVADSRSDVILVDTTGKTPASSAEDWPVAACLARLGGVGLHTLLVLPAWMRGRDAESVHDCYREAHPTGLVVSKLDETCQVGGVLHAAIPNQLPLTYFCNGPRVPEDIHPANVDEIVRTLWTECT